MKTNVITVSERATVKEALNVMRKEKTNGVVVVDKKDRVKGMFTVLDLIRHFVPDYLETDKQLAEFEVADRFASRAGEIAKNPIEPLMTKEVKTVHKEDTLLEAATQMTELQIRQLPVIDEKGILVGLVTRTSIKEAIGDLIN